MFSFISAVFYVIVLAKATPSSEPTVSIDAGTIQGGRCTGSSDAVFYKGIPYAQPPTGELRFAAPEAYSGKYPKGSLLANESASDCIQFGSEFAINDTLTSENCLYLNVWAPSNATKSSALPVKVWIYGGSEDAGGISYYLYDGCNMAQEDALLVTINYRLGPLGFLALESAGIQGNQGIQDILLALKWVKTNIAAFGGDPDKVLLFGQSAGATNAFVISTLPQAPQLIKAAITESGGGRDAELKSTIQSLGAAYAQNLSCADVSCLRTRSLNDLKTAFTYLPALNSGLGIDGAIGVGNAGTSQFAPYVDGKIIPSQPSTEGVKVPTIFGSALREGTIFALGQFASSPGGIAGITSDDYTTYLQDNFGSQASLIEKSYPMSMFNSTGHPGFFAISTVLAESNYLCSAYRGLNRAVVKGIPVWTYLFSHQPSCMWIEGIQSSALPLLGATHTVEIPYVFGNLENLPAPDGSCNSTVQDTTISSILMKAWTAMASTGDPSTDDFDWPQYGNSSSSLGINIVNSTTAGVVDYSHCALWDMVNEALLNSSSTNTTSLAGATPTSGTSGVWNNVP